MIWDGISFAPPSPQPLHVTFVIFRTFKFVSRRAHWRDSRFAGSDDRAPQGGRYGSGWPPVAAQIADLTGGAFGAGETVKAASVGLRSKTDTARLVGFVVQPGGEIIQRVNPLVRLRRRGEALGAYMHLRDRDSLDRTRRQPAGCGAG